MDIAFLELTLDSSVIGKGIENIVPIACWNMVCGTCYLVISGHVDERDKLRDTYERQFGSQILVLSVSIQPKKVLVTYVHWPLRIERNHRGNTYDGWETRSRYVGSDA